MKKVILLTGIMMLVAANAFAELNFTFTLSGFSKSKNVVVGYGAGNSTGAACTAAASDCVHFAALAKNTSGDKVYGAVDTQSSVYMFTGTAGTPLAATPAGIAVPTSGTYAPSGSWTSM